MTSISKMKTKDFTTDEHLQDILAKQLQKEFSMNESNAKINSNHGAENPSMANQKASSINDTTKDNSSSKKFFSNVTPANDTKTHMKPKRSLKDNSSTSLRSSFLSIAWVAGGATLAYRSFPDAFSSLPNLFNFLSTSTGLLTTLSVFVPAVFFQGLFKLSRQTKQIEKLAEVMDDTAQRLRQPEMVATECISNLNQNIRREILGNEARIRALLGDLVQERRLVISQAQRVHASIEKVQANLRQGLDENGNYLSQDIQSLYTSLEERLAQSREAMANDLRLAMESMGNHLNEKLQGLSASLINSGEDVSQKIGERVQEITNESLKKLSEKTGDLCSKIAEVSSDSANVLVDRIDEFYHGVEQKADNILSKMDNKTSVIESRLDSVCDKMSENDARFLENIDMVSDKLTYSLESRQNEFSSNIQDNVNKIFEENYTKLQGYLQNHGVSLEERMENIKEMINLGEETFSHMISRQADAIEQALNSNDEELNQKLSEYIMELRAKTQGLSDNWLKESDNLASAIENRLENLSSSLEGRLGNLSSSLEVTSDKLNNVFTSQIDLVEKNSEILQTTFELQESLIDHGQTAIENAFNTSQQRLNETVEGHISSITNKLSAAKENIATAQNNIEDHIVAISDKLVSTQNNMDSKLYSIREDLTGVSSMIADTLEQNLSNTIQSLVSGAEKASDILENVDIKLSENLQDNITKVSGQVEDISAKLENTINIQSENMLNNFHEIGYRLRNEVDDIKTDFDVISTKLSENIKDNANYVEQLSQNIISNVDQAQHSLLEAGKTLDMQVGQAFSAGEQHINNHLNKAMMAYSELENNMDRLAEKTNSQLDKQLSSLNELLLNRSQELSKTIQETSQPLVNLVSNLNENISSSINEGMMKHINSENEELMSAFKRRAQETMRVVNSMNQTLTENTSDILNKVSTTSNEVNSQLGGVLTNITSMQTEVENTAQKLLDNTKDACKMFVDGVEHLNDEFAKLGLSTEAAIERMSLFSQGFNKQSRFFEQSLHNFESKYNNLNSSLGDREAAIENLSSSLVSQTEMIEKALLSFDVLSRSLLQKENSVLSLSDRMKEVIGTEIKKALSEFYEASAQIKHVNGESAKANVTAETKELRENVMRQALQKQKNALDSLSSLSAASSNFYNKEANAQARKPIEKTAEKSPNLFVASATGAQQNTHGGFERTSSTSVFAKPKETMAEITSKAKNLNGYSADLHRKAQAETVKPATKDENLNVSLNDNLKPGEVAQKSNGWVSNLLARASQIEEKNIKVKSTDNSKDAGPISLVELSSKIIKSLDSKALSRLWRYYYEGNKNVFTDKIYTLDAQRLLFNIRYYYKHNETFAHTVDQYIAEFERLLEGVKNKSNSFDRLERYLISDSGKVYTMLAHACGHL